MITKMGSGLLVLCCVLSSPLLYAVQIHPHSKMKHHRDDTTQVTGMGFSLEVSYDAQLDRVAPGYHIVNVVVTNDSMNIVLLDPDKDRWFVNLEDKKYPAIVNLQQKDREAWKKMSRRAKSAITYPLAVPIGAHLLVDLFVPDKIDLQQATGISVQVDSLGRTIDASLKN